MNLRHPWNSGVVLLIKQSGKLLVGKPSLTDDAPHDGFGEVKARMIRYGHPAGFGWVLQLHMGAGLFMDIKAGLLQGPEDLSGFEASESGHWFRL